MPIFTCEFLDIDTLSQNDNRYYLNYIFSKQKISLFGEDGALPWHYSLRRMS